MMKQLFLFVWMSLLLAGCTAQTGGYVIEDSSPEYVDGQYMYLLDGVSWQALDSARIENSAFRIASNNKGSGIGILYMGASSNPEDLAQVEYWAKTVAQEGLPWTNITAEIPAGKPASFSPTWKAYGLTGIPANFLIDTATGQIVAKNLRGEALDKQLAGLLTPEE